MNAQDARAMFELQLELHAREVHQFALFRRPEFDNSFEV